jgi:signal transduction histidine kinase
MPISPSRIFDRFQKDPANSNSMGLGLAIAKKICDTSGLDLRYVFDNNRHSFSVSFKIMPVI